MRRESIPIDLSRLIGMSLPIQKHSGDGDGPKKKAKVSPPTTEIDDLHGVRTPAAVQIPISTPTHAHSRRVVQSYDTIVKDRGVALAASQSVKLQKDVRIQQKELTDTFERTMKRQIEASQGWVALEGQMTEMFKIHNWAIQKMTQDGVKTAVGRKIIGQQAVKLMLANKELAELKAKATRAEEDKEAELEKSFNAGYDEADEAYVAQVREITDALYQRGWIDGLRAVNTPENSPLIQNPPKYPISAPSTEREEVLMKNLKEE